MEGSLVALLIFIRLDSYSLILFTTFYVRKTLLFQVPFWLLVFFSYLTSSWILQSQVNVKACSHWVVSSFLPCDICSSYGYSS